MKKLYLLLATLLCVGVAYYGGNDTTRHIYIITTNDIHANINAIPRLATVVGSYRAKGDVLLFDSGDRVVGNAFVDSADPSGAPMIEIFNRLGYNAVTFGNHEFDKLRENLAALVTQSEFATVCANFAVREGIDFPEVVPIVIFEREGLRIGVTGVVDTEYAGCHPAGKEAGFVDFEFTNDAATAAAWCDSLDSRSDFVILLSHMGYDTDTMLAAERPACDWIAGGHSHTVAATDIEGIHISQNGKNLGLATVADITVDKGRIVSVEYSQIDLNNFEADEEYMTLVADIKSRMPWLNEKVGQISSAATQSGIANMLVDAQLERRQFEVGGKSVDFTPELSFYHFGGVRMTDMLPGDVTLGDIENIDPFGSTLCIGRMTGAEIRRMILDKYNSYGANGKVDKESHYLYFRSNLPYEVILGTTPAERPDAIDVQCGLDDNKEYNVVMCNYIADSYLDEATLSKITRTDNKVVDTLRDYIVRRSADGDFTPDNTVRQSERRQ